MIYVVCGPTGVGKTKLSEELAEKYDAIVINADAVQVYQKLNIGSAKIKTEEMKDVPHFLFDKCEITDNYTVCDYQRDVRKIINENKEKNIVLVGGTGLYISAALFDYNFSEELNKTDYSDLSNDELYSLALEKDPNMDIHKNNRVRLERFLDKEKVSINGTKLLYEVLFIGLTTKRDVLYDIINSRVDKMFDDGLLKEVENLYSYKRESRVLNSAIGYKEVISYLDKKICYTEMVDLIKKNSRHYAKRQYTWFNNKMDVNWFDVNYENFGETITDVINFIDSKCKKD